MSPFKYRLLPFVLLMLCFNQGHAQKEDNIWVFGDAAMIDFNTGTPVGSATGNGYFAWEGCASISDALGHLLFYTNAFDVYGSNHILLPNGGNLIPTNPSSTSQGAVIVPLPGHPDRYYIFSLEEADEAGRLYYSIVDKSLNGGIGDVVAGQKGILVDDGLWEKMTVVPDCDRIWLMARSRTGNAYKAYLITAAGLNTTPVLSVIGNGAPIDYNRGTIRFSPDGKKMAAALQTYSTTGGPSLEVYDFNTATGQLSNLVVLDNVVPSDNNYYAVAFSPDNSKLYASTMNLLRQFNLNAGSVAAIRASRTDIGTVSLCSDIRQGPDDKLYLSSFETPYLHRIDEPDAAGAACNLILNIVSLPFPAMCNIGLPNTTISLSGTFKENKTSTRDTLACGQLRLESPLPGRNCTWSTGATAAAIDITAPGVYWCQYTQSCIRYTDTVHVAFIAEPKLTLSADTTICADASTEIKATVPPPFTLLWSNGSRQQAITVSPGVYKVSVSYQGCSVSDSVRIDSKACQCSCNVPSAFSPNGDGLNDQFQPVLGTQCTNWSNYTFSVYNRWGERVYEGHSPLSGWDGRYRGQPADGGSYRYDLHFRNGKKDIYRKGDVLLIR